jgi:hypothetical protein
MGSTGNDQPQVQVLTRDAGPVLDALIAEKVMGESLTVPRERALAMVGAHFVSVTGRPFKLNVFGARLDVNVPDGESLGGHPSDDNWNQRYFRYIAEYLLRDPELGPPVEQLVQQAMRAPAKSYSTDIAAAWTVVEKLTGRVDPWPHYRWVFALSRVPGDDDLTWRADFRHIQSGRLLTGVERSAPLAIFRAALAAVEAV